MADSVADIAEVVGIASPRISQLFGPWCILIDLFRSAVEKWQGVDLRQHAIDTRSRGGKATPWQRESAGSNTEYELLDNGIAIINVEGPLMKYQTSVSEGSSMILLKREVRLASNNPAVKGIVLRIDSPGGTSSGTNDLASEVAAAATQKPVYAYCEDMCASAAYWIASQCTKVFANPTAMVGSIGTYAVIQDSSGMAAQLGVKVHVVKAGEHKGNGVPGTEVTHEQLAEWQSMVNEVNEFFIRAVSSGRNMTLAATREIADGRVHVGQAAIANGLIDGIASFDEVVNQLSLKSKRKNTMSESTAPVAATLAELKAGLPGATSDYVIGCLEQNETLTQAQTGWLKKLSSDNAALKASAEAEKKKKKDEDEAEAKTAKEKAEKDKACKSHAVPGVEKSVTTRVATISGDAVSLFNEAVHEHMKTGMSRRDSIKAAQRRDPALHQEYLLETNGSKPKAQELIRERLS